MMSEPSKFDMVEMAAKYAPKSFDEDVFDLIEEAAKYAPENDPAAGMFKVDASRLKYKGILLYFMAEKCADLSRRTPMKLLKELRKEYLTDRSLFRLMKFYYTYVFSEETYERLNGELKRRFGPYRGGHHFKTAHLANNEFFTELRLKDNGALVGTFREIIRQLDSDRGLGNVALDMGDFFNRGGVEFGARYAAIIKKKFPLVTDSQEEFMY